MKIKWRAVPLALGPWALCSVLDAQSLAGPEAAAAESAPDMHRELMALIRADAGALVAPPATSPPASAAAGGNVVTLDPYIVREPRSPDLPDAPTETPLSHFLRTGTIYTHVGKKVTSSLYLNIGPSEVPKSGTTSQSFRAELGWRILF